MSEFLMQIDPPDLARFAAALNAGEAEGAEFVKSALAVVEGATTNLATLRRRPGGRPPSALRATAFGAAPPPGRALLWSGAVLVAGTQLATSVYR